MYSSMRFGDTGKKAWVCTISIVVYVLLSQDAMAEGRAACGDTNSIVGICKCSLPLIDALVYPILETKKLRCGHALCIRLSAQPSDLITTTAGKWVLEEIDIRLLPKHAFQQMT